MGFCILNIARFAVCAIGLVVVQPCWSTPIALKVSGKSLDAGGIFGPVGSAISLQFTVQYDTEQPDYDNWNGAGRYQPATYVGLSVKNSEGDEWLAESVNGDSLMIVSVSSYWAKLHQFYVSGMTNQAYVTPRGDSIVGVNMYLQDKSLNSLIDETLPVPIDGLNHMKSAAIAIIDGSYSAPSGGIFFLSDWSASPADIVIRAVPEPGTMGLIFVGIASIGLLRRRPIQIDSVTMIDRNGKEKGLA